MRKITKYFRNAVAAFSQGNINFKENKFTTITWDEIKNGIRSFAGVSEAVGSAWMVSNI